MYRVYFKNNSEKFNNVCVFATEAVNMLIQNI